MLDDWKEQWERVEIGLGRVRGLYAGVEEGFSAGAAYDLYAFFLNCWHLRDWLTMPVPPVLDLNTIVKPHIAASRPLRVCGDLADRTKHLRLTQKAHLDKNTGPTAAGVSINVPATTFWLSASSGDPIVTINSQRHVTVQYSWSIRSGGISYDALRLAERCTEDWRKLLRRHKSTRPALLL